MEGWKYWIGKKVYLILKNNRNYQGHVLEVDDSGKPIVWMVLSDKFEKRITFCVDEIKTIQEEE